MTKPQPFILEAGGNLQQAVRLAKEHKRFNEEFLQAILADHPELLPVQAMRPDVGHLLCIGREVPTGDGGAIDNLYLSTSGYLVVVETKLWRNPQSRREVVAQVLDYVKAIVSHDFEWLEKTWERFCQERKQAHKPLTQALSELPGAELDEADLIDRINRCIERGDVLALIVGDGIESRLQQLVSHLCRDSAHLRYSLGLVSLHCYQLAGRDDLLIVPELVQDVEPIERAYVRIELDEALGNARVTSVADDERRDKGKRRITLSEDDLFEALATSCGSQTSDRLRRFLEELTAAGIDSEFRSSSVMLKIAAPAGVNTGSSVLAIHKSGAIFNPAHGLNQASARWGWDPEAVDRTIGECYRQLNALDDRFAFDGISHVDTKRFIPLGDVLDKLDGIAEVLRETDARVKREAERIGSDHD